MKLCIPVEENLGLDSPVCAHFGSAPFFLIVDSESEESETIVNTGAHHAHGMCRPLALLEDREIDCMVVGGIGRGALLKLQAADIGVYRTQHPTVRATVDAFRSGSLNPVTLQDVCAGHNHAPGPTCH